MPIHKLKMGRIAHCSCWLNMGRIAHYLGFDWNTTWIFYGVQNWWRSYIHNVVARQGGSDAMCRNDQVADRSQWCGHKAIIQWVVKMHRTFLAYLFIIILQVCQSLSTFDEGIDARIHPYNFDDILASWYDDGRTLKSRVTRRW